MFPIVQNSTGQPIAIATSPRTTQGIPGIKSGPGRPKGRTSVVAVEDRPWRLGRPPGTGYLQKARALSSADELQPAKRSVGRPHKVQAPPTQATQATPVVSVDFGPLVGFHDFLNNWHLFTILKFIPGT